MKTKVHLKSVKSHLIEAVSATVKHLQQDCASNADNSHTVQSDSDASQYLTAILEAAFIHGLKSKYYDSKKHQKDLPRPQFWNLIGKISHRETIAQTKKLSYVESRVGRCRAWLRLALNESSLSSYIFLLLQTADGKSLLNHYYESYAFFRDHEQSDIFLRYLQGAENLHFELSCNSSILNSWTKTPLELGGIIQFSNTVKWQPRLSGDRSVSTPDLCMQKTSSTNYLASPESSKLSSNKRSSLTQLQQMPTSISPASSITSLTSNNVPYLQVHGGAKEVGGENVDLLSIVKTPSINDEPENEKGDFGDVLHARQLAKRKINKSKGNKIDGSMSDDGRSRSNSVSSTASLYSTKSPARAKTKLSANSNNNHFHLTQHPHSDSEIQSNSTKSRSDMQKLLPSVQSTSVMPAKDGPYSLSNDKEITRRISNDIDVQEKFNNKVSLNSVDLPTKNYIEDSSTDTVQNSSAKEEPSSSNTDHYDSVADEDDFDIYAVQPSPSLFINSDSTVDEESSEVSCIVGSLGRGNSLLCGVGWSSEEVDRPNVKSPRPAMPIVQPPANTESESVEGVAAAHYREGFLQKKGNTLAIWRTRWFVLHKGSLSYYKDRTCEDMLGFIYLRDVVNVNERHINKNKSIRLRMISGTEHQIAADSKKEISNWSKEIKKVVDEYRAASPFVENMEAIEKSYEVLDEYKVDEDGPLRSTEGNTSYLEAMKGHITRIANERGLDTQNYQCADCASPIGLIYGAPLLCSFTGQSYCSQCHENDEQLIPARMIHNWDFKKHKISKRSKKFLEDIWLESLIELDRVNPLIYQSISVMKQLLPLRSQLAMLHPYISTCRMLPIGKFDSKLQGHYYMLKNPHLYSIHDLHKAQGGGLFDVLKKAVAFGVEHVYSCTLCSSKGHICEICQRNEIIFSFEDSKINQCEECKSVYHKECLKDFSKCPKCVRRCQRMKIEEQYYYERSEESQ